jgi:hypothetical protein
VQLHPRSCWKIQCILSCVVQTFQVSRNYCEIPAFLFAFTHHAWSDFLPAFLNLTCRGFFLWGNYSHFFSFAQCSMHSFCQRQYLEVLRSLENVCFIVYQKETKLKLGDSEPEERYFLPFGKEEPRIKFHIFIAWTHKVNVLRKRQKKTSERQFSGDLGNSNFKISPRAGQLRWHLVDTNLRKLPSRIKFFKTWQVWWCISCFLLFQ